MIPHSPHTAKVPDPCVGLIDGHTVNDLYKTCYLISKRDDCIMRTFNGQSDLDQITDLVKGISDILTYKGLRFTTHFFHRYAERTGRVPETLYDVHQIVTDLVDLATKTVVTIWIPET